MSRGTWERKMGKRTKGNYIKGYFLRLFLLVAVLVSVMGIALLQFSKRVVGDEIIKLHQTILRSTAGETASVLGGLRESLLEIAENVQLTEWLESGVGDESEIDRLTEDEIYLNFKRGGGRFLDGGTGAGAGGRPVQEQFFHDPAGEEPLGVFWPGDSRKHAGPFPLRDDPAG